MYDRETLLVKVATMFYEDNYTQTKIAEELGISRPTIATLLNEAIEQNIVRIIISHPNKQILDKQNQLNYLFPETEITVAPSVKGNNNPKIAVGEATANLLSTLLSEVNSMGIGWGSTIAEVINAFEFYNFKHLSIIPIIGGIGFSDVKYQSNYLASELAQKISAKVNYLYAPALADNKEIKDAFYRSELVKNILELGKKVDLVLVGLGNPLENSNYLEHGHLTNDEIKELSSSDIIGDLLTSFFNSSGDILDSDISNRMIGLSIKDLSQINNVIVVATGKEKVKSTNILLQKKIASHLIIDEELADNLLNLIE